MNARDTGADKVIRPTLDVATFLSDLSGGLELRVLAGSRGLGNRLDVPRIQKLSLALTGFTAQIRTGRIQVLGETETRFCADLSPARRREVFDEACKVPVTAFLVTKGLQPPPELLEAAERHGVPVLACPEKSSIVINRIQRFLEERLAPRVRLHGVLLDVHGFGTLLLGKSGVGKSECALELIQRGHRLVADDVVEIKALSNQVLMGSGPEALRHHMELRGIGIINITDLFGVAAVRTRKRVEMAIRLVRWEEGKQYERLGLDDHHLAVLDTRIPYLELPVADGRNMAILVEVAVRTHVLKLKGYHPAREFTRRLDDQIARQGAATETLPPTNASEVASSEMRSMHSRTRFAPDVINRTRRQR